MTEGQVTINTKGFLSNRLLNRKQMIVIVNHPGKKCPKLSELRERLAKMYESSASLVFAFGFKTAFGGGVTKGFALIYDSMDKAKSFEPKHRLVKAGVIKKVTRPGRKQRKERKHRMMKVRGVKKRNVGAGKK